MDKLQRPKTDPENFDIREKKKKNTRTSTKRRRNKFATAKTSHTQVEGVTILLSKTSIN